jgi:hypothetical protein
VLKPSLLARKQMAEMMNAHAMYFGWGGSFLTAMFCQVKYK